MPPEKQDWLRLAGKRVLLAGAGGIGAACAVGYANAGAATMVVDRDVTRLSELAVTPAFREAKGLTQQADLSLPGSGAEVVAAAVEQLGGLDVLVHSVGTNDRRPILDYSERDWDHVVRTNLTT